MRQDRDPRREKLRDYRRLGHCRRAGCMLCHMEKKMHGKQPRQAAKAALAAMRGAALR